MLYITLDCPQMATTLASPARLIEYPDDIAGCKKLRVNGKDLLYYLIQNESEGGSAIIMVVLGYMLGQKQDIVPKDLIETIGKENRSEIARKLLNSMAFSADVKVLFL